MRDPSPHAPHHQRHEHGELFAFRIAITVPGKDIIVDNTHANDAPQVRAYFALRYAFRTARRALQDYERNRRQEVELGWRPQVTRGR